MQVFIVYNSRKGGSRGVLRVCDSQQKATDFAIEMFYSKEVANAYAASAYAHQFRFQAYKLYCEEFNVN